VSDRSRAAVVTRWLVIRVVVIAGAVGLWWIASSVVWSDNPVISRIGPDESLPALWNGLFDGDLGTDLRASLIRLVAGLLIAVSVGVPLGLALGSSRLVEEASTPVVNFLRMISPLAWAPIVIVAFGVGDAPVLFLIAITACGRWRSEPRPG